MTFGERLKQLRNNKKLSQAALGKLIKKDAAQIRRYERYESLPSVEVAFKLAEQLEVSIEELIFGTSDDNTINNKLRSNFKKLLLLPENKKQSVLDFIEAFVNQNHKP